MKKIIKKNYILIILILITLLYIFLTSNLPSYLFDNLPVYQPIARLSDSMAESMRMLADIQRIKGELPGLDCGSCGAPTCRALAEDIVKGLSNIDKCLIKKCKDQECGK